MIRSELAKLRYARTTWVVAAVAVAESLLTSAFVVFLVPLSNALVRLNEVVPNATDADSMAPETLEAMSFGSAGPQVFVADFAGGTGFGIGTACVCAVVLGALAVTSEYRHGSIVNAVLARPNRWSLLAAKAAALAVTLLLVAGLLAAASGAMLLVGHVVSVTGLLLSAGTVATLWVKGAATLVLFGLMGMGVGFLLRGQVAALVVLFAAVTVESVLRPLAALFVPGITPVSFLPFGLVNDLMATGSWSVEMMTTAATLSPLIAFVALVGWAVAVAGLGGLRLARRDVPA